MQPTSSNSHNVFACGTLKRGQVNHSCLTGGPYPMALLTGRSDAVIHGELFRVSDAGLHRLDQLEGYPASTTAVSCSSATAPPPGPVTELASK